MRRVAAAVLLAVAVPVAAAEKYKETDPVPPGATAKVLPVSGKVLEIRGLASAVSGKAESLAAAMKDLGAQQSGTKVHIALSSDVLFDFDKDVLRPEAAAALEKVVVVIGSYPRATVTIEGHSDNLGADDYNQRLSERRAKSVETWLKAHGVSTPITSRGWGESKPVVPNSGADGADIPVNRQKNRRVEIVVNTQ